MSWKLQPSEDAGEQHPPAELNVLPRNRPESIKGRDGNSRLPQIFLTFVTLGTTEYFFFAQRLIGIYLLLADKRTFYEPGQKRKLQEEKWLYSNTRLCFSSSQPSQRSAGTTAAALMWCRERRWWSDCVLEANTFSASADFWMRRRAGDKI